ncbi:MAG TPA: hypothetical protein PK816_05915, partial [Candidatus Cloacimonadota bacterium]|nr:hypothetical protein [Candidatus Cloacimonadota bacterium]
TLLGINSLNYCNPSLLIDIFNLISFTMTTVLLVLFFLYAEKIYRYYAPSMLIIYLKNLYIKKNNEIGFNSLGDLLLLSLKNQYTKYSKELITFFYYEFKNIRLSFKEKPVEYPLYFYNLQYQLLKEILMLNDKSDKNLEYHLVSNIWLWGENEKNTISSTTYKWMWSNLNLIIQYNRDDLILEHWDSADRHIAMSLAKIYYEYDYHKTPEVVINKDIAETRDQERNQFFEFYYALGGLLLYNKKYKLINELFNYTNSLPPKCELLPESMQEIFDFFKILSDERSDINLNFSNNYPIPKKQSLTEDKLLLNYTSHYLVLLFLRQYLIFPYLSTMKPLDLPQLPNNARDVKLFLTSLEFFKDILIDLLSNKALLKELRFDIITEEWCKQNDKLYPINYINNLEMQLKNKYEELQISEEIDPNKISLFFASTKERLTHHFVELFHFLTENEKVDSDNIVIHGEKITFEKNALSKNQEKSIINYDNILSEFIISQLDRTLCNSFLQRINIRYIFKTEDIFKAIKKLMNHDRILVNCGVYLNFFIEVLKIPGLTKSSYYDFNIIEIKHFQPCEKSFFIFNKKEIPSLVLKELASDIINELDLEKIDDKYPIYASVIDFNTKDSDFKNKYAYTLESDKQNKSALLTIGLHAEIQWDKNVSVIQVIPHYKLDTQGIVNNLKDLD